MNNNMTNKNSQLLLKYKEVEMNIPQLYAKWTFYTLWAGILVFGGSDLIRAVAELLGR